MRDPISRKKQRAGGGARQTLQHGYPTSVLPQQSRTCKRTLRLVNFRRFRAGVDCLGLFPTRNVLHHGWVYLEFSRFYSLHNAGLFFMTRTKRGFRLQIRDSRALAGLLRPLRPNDSPDRILCCDQLSGAFLVYCLVRCRDQQAFRFSIE